MFSLRSLEGKQSGANGKGLTDVITEKKKLRMHIENLIDPFPWPADVKLGFRKNLADHKTYHDNLKYYPDEEGAPDLAWKSSWPRSADLALVVAEELVYNTVYDGSIRTGLKNRKTASEIFMYQPVAEAWEEVTDAVADELQKAKVEQDKLEAESQKQLDLDVRQDDASRPSPSMMVPVQVANTGGKESKLDALVKKLWDHKTLKGLTDEKKLYWISFAVRSFDSTCSLRQEPESETQVCDTIVDSAVGKLKGITGQDYVMIHGDVKQSGEAATSPHIRISPCREKWVVKMLGGALKARLTLQPKAVTMIDGDLVLLLDGGKHGNEHLLTKPLCVDGKMSHLERKAIR